MASFPLTSNQAIEVENNIRNTAVCVLRLVTKSPSEGDVTCWEVILTSKITAVTACDFMSAVVTEDNLVSVFSTKTGRRLHLPIVLNSFVSRIDSTNYYLMLITVDGRVSVYDFNSHTSIVRNESLLSLFSDSGHKDSPLTITHSEITANGTPVISLSNKKSFIFDPSFKHWSLLSNPTDLLNSCSDLRPSGHRSDPDSFPLARIQAINSRGVRSGTNIFSSNAGLQSKATISLIDQQLAASFVVGSKAEYKFWLLALAQALTVEGREDRLRELCSFLMGPMFAGGNPTDGEWSPTILGHDKRALLNEVLLTMTSNLRLQRLYTEFKDQIAFASMIASDPFQTACLRNNSNSIKESSTQIGFCNPTTINSIRQEIRMTKANESSSNFIAVNHKETNPVNGSSHSSASSRRETVGSKRNADICPSANGVSDSHTSSKSGEVISSLKEVAITSCDKLSSRMGALPSRNHQEQQQQFPIQSPCNQTPIGEAVGERRLSEGVDGAAAVSEQRVEGGGKDGAAEEEEEERGILSSNSPSSSSPDNVSPHSSLSPPLVQSSSLIASLPQSNHDSIVVESDPVQISQELEEMEVVLLSEQDLEQRASQLATESST